MADTNTIVEQLSGLTVLEIAGLVKQLEEKWGVSAAAPVAMAALRRRRRWQRLPGGGREDDIRSHPQGNGREQDRRDQGSSRRSSWSRPGGSQGAGRRRAQDNQGRRDQGGSRRDQEEGRSGWREGRNQVIEKFTAASNALAHGKNASSRCAIFALRVRS